MLIALLVIVGIIVLFVFMFIGIYNKLVRSRNQYKNSFANIDVQLKRRYDLIPNLVETAKGYLKHEKETLDAVVRARSGAVAAEKVAAKNPGDASAMKGLLGAESALAGAMSRFMVVMEAYPDLKGNENMKTLMEELTSTENKISFSRQRYNDDVTNYNTARETFPNVLIAGPMNFQAAILFEIEDEVEREAVKVSFD